MLRCGQPVAVVRPFAPVPAPVQVGLCAEHAQRISHGEECVYSWDERAVMVGDDLAAFGREVLRFEIPGPIYRLVDGAPASLIQVNAQVRDRRTADEQDVTLLIPPIIAEGLAAALTRRANSIKRQEEQPDGA